jgi:hypothetical protein
LTRCLSDGESREPKAGERNKMTGSRISLLVGSVSFVGMTLLALVQTIGS